MGKRKREPEIKVREAYLEQLLHERKENRKASRTWLECFICQTPPTFEQCKLHFEKQGMKVHRDDYEAACKKVCKEPQYNEASSASTTPRS